MHRTLYFLQLTLSLYDVQGTCRKPVLLENIRCLKRELALTQVRNLMQETPEIALDSIVHIVQNLSPAQRAEVSKAIGRLESSSAPVAVSVGAPATPAGSPTTSNSTSSDNSPSVVP